MHQYKATLKSKEIKPVTLAIIELHLSEGISQSVHPSVSRLFSQSVKDYVKFLKF